MNAIFVSKSSIVQYCRQNRKKPLITCFSSKKPEMSCLDYAMHLIFNSLATEINVLALKITNKFICILRPKMHKKHQIFKGFKQQK